MDMSEIREALNALVNIKRDIERQLMDINDRICDIKTDAEELLDCLADGVGKIRKEDAKLSREMFDVYLRAGIGVGAKFNIRNNSSVPQPVEVVGIDCQGFVCRLPNGKETRLLWEYADKYADKLDVLGKQKGETK